MKRVLTIQDVSCVGKCSLTVALPIISAFGIETAVLPTAVLSTHTAFKGFTFRDLTLDMLPCAEHWENEKIEFDSLYTGYLGSKEQIDIVKTIFNKFKKDDNFILVDPVMADNGKLYAGFSEEFPSQMAKLCQIADVIVPNLTEASFLLNVPYVSSGYNEEYIKNMLIKLTDLGAKKAVLTGVSFEPNKLGVYAYDKESGKFCKYFTKKLPYSFHGTGDIFASTLVGALAKNKSFYSSLKLAVDYTVLCISKTAENPDHNWYGVEFERALPYLIKKI